MLKWLQRTFGGGSAFTVIGDGAPADAVVKGAKANGQAVARAKRLAPGQTAKAIVVASGDEVADLEAARSFVAGWKPDSKDAEETVLAVVCDAQKTITALQDLDAGSPANLRVRPLSASAYVARTALLNHSFAKLQYPGAQPVVVGTGHEAEHILIQLFRMMHLPGVPPRVTVVGPDAQAWVAQLVRDVPALGAIGAITAATAIDGPSVVFVANAKVWDGVAPPDWFVPVYWLPGAGRSAAAGTIAIPAIDWQAAIATLFDDPADVQAQAIHQLYLEERRQAGDAIGSRPSMQPWAKLPERFRAASRHQADHIGYKLAAIDCHAVAAMPEIRFAFTPDELDMLSEIEHRRWAAVQMLDGWQYGETRDDATKRTPLLVPYDSLTQEIKDLDKLSVRAVPRQVDRTQRSILRDLRIGFDVAGDVGAAFASGFAQLLEEIAARHSDRVPVLLTGLATPAQQTAARTALETGKVRLNLVLDPATQPTADAKNLTTRAETICEAPSAFERLDFLIVRSGDTRASSGQTRIVEIDGDGSVRKAPWL